MGWGPSGDIVFRQCQGRVVGASFKCLGLPSCYSPVHRLSTLYFDTGSFGGLRARYGRPGVRDPAAELYEGRADDESLRGRYVAPSSALMAHINADCGS